MVCATQPVASTLHQTLALLMLIGLQVIMGVTDEELRLLDAFEDVEYTRTRVEISLAVSMFKPYTRQIL